MQATFLPTLAYLSLIVVCWVGKLLLLPRLAFSAEARVHKHPLRLTAALFFVFAVLFMGMHRVAGDMQQQAADQGRPRHATPRPMPSQVSPPTTESVLHAKSPNIP